MGAMRSTTGPSFRNGILIGLTVDAWFLPQAYCIGAQIKTWCQFLGTRFRPGVMTGLDQSLLEMALVDRLQTRKVVSYPKVGITREHLQRLLSLHCVYMETKAPSVIRC